MPNWTSSDKFNTGGGKTPRLDELIHMPKLPENETVIYRLIGPMHLVAEMWFEIFTKGGESTARIRKLATNFNSETGEFDGSCPYQELLELKPRIVAYSNAINRDAQDKAPRKMGKMTDSEKKKRKVGAGDEAGEFHVKEKGSSIWTPVQAIRFPSSAANKVSDTSTTNKVVDKKTGAKVQVGPNHPKHGYDISIKYNSKAKTPSDQYFIQKEAKTKLTDEELEYCLQDIWQERPETPKQAKIEAEKFLKMGLVIRDEKGKIINSPPKAGKKDKKAKPDYLGGLGNDDDDDDGKKSKKDKKKDKGGKSKDLDLGGKKDKKKDKSDKGKSDDDDKKSKKDKGGKADKGKADKSDKGKDKKKDKGGKSSKNKFDL